MLNKQIQLHIFLLFTIKLAFAQDRSLELDNFLDSNICNGCNLSNINLSDINLDNAELENTNLANTN